MELARKLGARGIPGETVEALLDALEGERLLSDARFAESFVRQRTERGVGPRRIREELRERGVGAEVATPVLEAGDYDWVAGAREARARRFRGAPPADFAERARQARFLEYRGFTHEQIRQALDEPE